MRGRYLGVYEAVVVVGALLFVAILIAFTVAIAS